MIPAYSALFGTACPMYVEHTLHYITLSYQYQNTYTTKDHFFFGIDVHFICVHTVYCVCYVYVSYESYVCINSMCVCIGTSTLQIVLRVDHVTLSSVRTVLFPSPHDEMSDRAKLRMGKKWKKHV